MILACNPKYAPRLSEEEKTRRKALRDTFRPGLVLEYIHSDYHEEDVAPPGFHEIGDYIELVRVVEIKPITLDDTNEKVGEYPKGYAVWLCKSHRWGEKIQDALYLEAMTKISETMNR